MRKSKADYIRKQELEHIMAALTPANRLAMELSMATGLRISDVLGIKLEQLKKGADRRISVRELKTGKVRRVKLPVELYNRALAMAGRLYVFEHRLDWKKHRTRQSVYKDVRRASKLFRVKEHVSPHTARKTHAVGLYARSGDLDKVQKIMNHRDPAVTLLYACADVLTARRLGKEQKITA